MKTLIEFIRESGQDTGLIDEMVQDYLKNFGSSNICSAVETAIKNTNNILEVFNKNQLAEYVNGQMLGRIIEKELAKSCDFNGFTFRQGSEGKDEKDIECESVGEYLDEKYNDILGNVKEKHNYGIELKCTQSSKPVGNKSYAMDPTDDNTRKGKQSFYITITNIHWKNGSGENLSAQITNYNIYFGFLRQIDWKGAAKGNSASVVPDAWKRMIRLK